ncbi:MAG: efflux RND transporter permease subunit, partial [Planctomycetota bacterium]|nr:efflux RND transporter permease subunit [Planctomycetota bacterium]
VNERLQIVADRMPEGVNPTLAPISSIMGQIMMIGMWSETGETSTLELRTLADWVVRRQLLTIPGVSQVITMGGDRKQYQVLVNPHAMHTFEITLDEIEAALKAGNLNVTGGYLEDGPKELLVRGLGRVQSIEDIEKIVVERRAGGRSIRIADLAKVVEGPQVKRGDSAVNGRQAVVLTIQKQPGTDTRHLTEEITKAVADMRAGLPKDVVIDASLYQQRQFIDYAVANVAEALRDGAVLVVIVLFLFLLNFRTTAITLTAIPLSIVTTALVFRWFDMSINVMTLGGLAVAMGELVDDAIVDVENIYRRLKENAAKPLETRSSALQVVFTASREVRSSIAIGTAMVVIVFMPLFALTGMEGRLFAPLGMAYIVSILASMIVSMTVTPVLSYYLLPNAKATHRTGDGFLLRGLKRLATIPIRLSMTRTGLIAAGAITAVAVLLSGVAVTQMGTDFLPPFNEGAAQVNFFLPAGASLEASKDVRKIVDSRLMSLMASPERPQAPILDFIGKTGRAELDEHVMSVNTTEYVLRLNPDTNLSRQGVIDALRKELDDVPGIQYEVEQPIQHLISHMLSGVTAQIAIKLYGDDLGTLRRKANEIKTAIADVPGLAEPVVEQQATIPQLRLELRRDKLAFYGVSAAFVNDFIETAMNGRVVSTVLDGQRQFDLLVRFDEPYRTDLVNLHRMHIELPDGTKLPLSELAHVYEGGGPNEIMRENARRRIVVRVNTLGRDLGGAVAAIRERVAQEVEMPEGYVVSYGGQFEAQQEATQRITLLSALAIAGVGLLLYSSLRSVSVVFQILVALPVAFAGGVAALLLTGQTLSVAAMVGFISLGGIAARNGILLVSHYIDLYRTDGFTKDMILRGSLERLAPVLMTALTTGLGLIPLVIGGHLPGKEVLYPVATVILGGLVTSTACEYILRPGLFWFFTGKRIERLAAAEAEMI